MQLRACLTCGAISNASRCPRHRTTTARGLGHTHRKASAHIQPTDPCHWCGGYGTADDPITADHLRPRARGGRNTPANYVPAHRSCNSRRGAA